ncbi:MAG: glutamine amidotransferase-related protein [Promethearchaeota archaeon]|jgi:GMP synthase-like glutamine amidotransferase
MINAKFLKNDNNNRILLIDNYSRDLSTDRIERTEAIVRDCKVEIKTVHYTQFKPNMVKDYIGIILSGSELNVSSFYYDEPLYKKFKPQLELIQNTNQLPILAICFGLHLVAYAYGAQIGRMGIPDLKGRIIFILIDKTDKLVCHKNIPVNAHHLDFVSPNDCKIQKGFRILSTSKTMGYKMVQYMRHIEKPIYSLQFHPETHNKSQFLPKPFDKRIANKTKVIGQEIIENFIMMCLKKKENPEKRL